jgi:uncharacterized integral membrane protein
VGVKKIRGVGLRLAQLALDGRWTRAAGWGCVIGGYLLGAVLLLVQYAQNDERPPHPDYAWAWPWIGVCLGIALIGLVLLFLSRSHPNKTGVSSRPSGG